MSEKDIAVLVGFSSYLLEEALTRLRVEKLVLPRFIIVHMVRSAKESLNREVSTVGLLCCGDVFR